MSEDDESLWARIDGIAAQPGPAPAAPTSPRPRTLAPTQGPAAPQSLRRSARQIASAVLRAATQS